MMYNTIKEEKGLELLGKRKTKHVCQECGYESARWMGKCPSCNQWNTLVEELIPSKSSGPISTITLQKSSTPEKITTIKSEKEPRIITGLKELDRVLGGGIVPGSLVLIGGDPGIGKSTLLLQISSLLADKQLPVLYISGEESVQQTKLRAERLNISADLLYVLS